MGIKIKSRFVGYTILILLILVIIFLLGVLIYNPFEYNKQEIYASFISSTNIGFDLNKTALTFGEISPGGSSTRGIILTNNKLKVVHITISVKGDIKDFIYVSKNDFILIPNESINISFTVNPPKNITLKKYDGEVVITSKR